jgi:hypothetical protein
MVDVQSSVLKVHGSSPRSALKLQTLLHPYFQYLLTTVDTVLIM